MMTEPISQSLPASGGDDSLAAERAVAVAKARIARRLRDQAEACARRGSELYEHLLQCAAADLEAGGPSWAVLRGHEDDPGPSALALRFTGAVNRLAVDGREPGLAAAFRELSVKPSAVWPHFKAVLERRSALLREMVDHRAQTNEVGRCAPLLAGFLTVSAEAELPLRLLEVGASAGLNLRFDRYRYLAQDFSWGPQDSAVQIGFELAGQGEFPSAAPIEVVERRGCDLSPIDPGAAEGELTLLSYIWPDQAFRIERMRAAIAIAQETPVAIDRDGGASWIGRELAKSPAGIATVVFHSFVAQYMGREERATFLDNLGRAGERASASTPLAWLRMELAGDLADVRLTTWPGGDERLLARADIHGSPVEMRSRPNGIDPN
jgi:hypothetical protein